MSEKLTGADIGSFMTLITNTGRAIEVEVTAVTNSSVQLDGTLWYSKEFLPELRTRSGHLSGRLLRDGAPQLIAVETTKVVNDRYEELRDLVVGAEYDPISIDIDRLIAVQQQFIRCVNHCNAAIARYEKEA